MEGSARLRRKPYAASALLPSEQRESRAYLVAMSLHVGNHAGDATLKYSKPVPVSWRRLTSFAFLPETPEFTEWALERPWFEMSSLTTLARAK
jgi:hypothetical protein